MAKDRATQIQERVAARSARIQSRMKDANPIGLGKEQLTHAELQNRIRTDEDTRAVMLERMGPDLMLDYMGPDPTEHEVEFE